MIKRGKIGFYGKRTRDLQKRLTAELFGLTFKDANVYLYLGSRDSNEPHINDIQNKVFFEVPDRAYNPNPKNITIGMEPFGEAPMDFSQFGIIAPLTNSYTFRVHVDEFECLGRPLIIGDVLEIPFLMKECNRALFEVTDVDDKPSFERFYYTITATVLAESRKTREISIDSGNGSFLDEVMVDLDETHDEMLPYTGFNEPAEPKPEVDFRRKNQASFLDDPNYEFGDDD